MIILFAPKMSYNDRIFFLKSKAISKISLFFFLTNKESAPAGAFLFIANCLKRYLPLGARSTDRCG